jgi:thiol-disulfide isomerase/thioredoxin
MDVYRVGDHECISCGECMGVCPTKAIEWKGSKFVLPANEIGETASVADPVAREARNARITKRNRILKIAVGVLMAAVLAGVLIYYNVIDRAPVAEPPAQQPPVGDAATPDDPVYGTQVGNLCYGADIEIIGGEGATFNVEQQRGKAVVLNFWYTTCGPCLQELPHFDALAKEYGDRVVMMAMCAEFDAAEAPAFVAENFASYSMLFGLDLPGEAYYNRLGGRDAYPFTVVVGTDGVIVATKQGPMSESELRTALDLALG